MQARLLVACSVPLLIISFLIAAAGVVWAALFPRFNHRKQAGKSARQNAADEFAFERAIECYESLIDAHAGGQR